MRYYSSNAVETALSAPITNSATSITVDSVAGFPVTFPYTLSIDADNGSKELVEVTNAAGTVLTVTRAVDGTSGVSHTLGAVVRHDHSARDFREPQEHMAASTGVHGVTGALLGATDAQTVTNKDLSSGTNTFPSSLATDVEVAAVQTNLTNHLNDASDAHDASAISFSPTGSIAATDAQAAIAEVATEAAAGLSGHTGASTGVHGVAGSVVGTSDSQTLTNKDLSSLTNTLPEMGLRQVVLFTADGTFTKASYPWLKRVRVRAIGGGGAGGGAHASSSNASAGSGGSAGEYAEAVIEVASLSASETVTVGDGGVGAFATTGGVGGDTSFGAHVIANGGAGGLAFTAGTSVFVHRGAAGVGGGTGDFTVPGAAGEFAMRASASNAASGAGGAGPFGGNGEGRSAFTGGAPGGSGNGHDAAPNSGAGGGGALNIDTFGSPGAGGGDGGSGLVIVELYG